MLTYNIHKGIVGLDLSLGIRQTVAQRVLIGDSIAPAGFTQVVKLRLIVIGGDKTSSASHPIVQEFDEHIDFWHLSGIKSNEPLDEVAIGVAFGVT